MTSITTYTPFIPDQYCVYHTTYSGTLLPQNYIGSTYVDRILIQNYHGSVASKRYKAIWESEIKLHPELFLTAIVSYHDTRPNATYKELQVQKIFNVVKSDLFINRAYASEGYGDTIYTPEERVSSTKKRLDTIANKSPEEKKASTEKRLDTIANKSPEEKAALSKKKAGAMANRTPEERTSSTKKRLDTIANRTPEEKSAIQKKRLDTMANKSPEEKTSLSKKMSDTMANKSPEEKAALSKKLSDITKGKTKAPFLSLIHNKKTYAKNLISRYYPDLKQYY